MTVPAAGIDWLASYPRSGNTWTRLALWTLKHRRPVDLASLESFGRMAVQRDQIDRLLECDSGVLTPREIETLRPHLHRMIAARRTLMKVHDAWRRTPAGDPVHDPAVTHATVYIVRDPRDVAISWAKFYDQPIDWAIRWLGDPNAAIDGGRERIHVQLPQHVGAWSGHVTSWIDASGMMPLVVRYEDMLTDPAASFAAMARHLGWPADAATVAMAVEATRFDALQAQERHGGFVERPGGRHPFFGVGRSGGWRGVLTPDQAARIEGDHGAVMARFGYL